MRYITYLLILILLLNSCKDAVVLDIKAVSFKQGDTISFGNNQAIIISGLPDSTLSITYNPADTGFSWTLHKPVYFKINGITQNAVLLDSIRNIKIGNSSFEFAKMKSSVQKFSDEKDGVKYIKLNNLIRAVFNVNSSVLDSLNSLIACDDNNKDVQPKLIILDRNVSALMENDQLRKFDTTNKIKPPKITVEFFRTFNSVLLDTISSNLFHIGDTIFYTTVKSYYTPFGASKIDITTNGILNVSFNRFFRTVIPRISIDSALAKNDSISVNIKQKFQSNTYSNEIYTPNVSNSNLYELGTIDNHLDFKWEKENTLLNENNFRNYNINRSTYIVAVLPLVFTFILGLIVIYLVTRNDLYEGDSNQGESSRWRKYFLVLFSLLFLLSLGRIFIAYNLSYTPPYFSFCLPTSIVISPLILLTVLYTWLIFILHDNNDAINFKFRLILIVATAALIFTLYKIMEVSFPFYLLQFKESFNFFKPSSNEVYYQTIFTLLIFSVVISLSLIFVRITKFIFLTTSAFLCLFFIIQKSSYSVSALLIVLALISIIITAMSKLIVLNYESKFSWRIGRFFLLIIPSVLIFLLVALLWKHDGGYFINLTLFPIVISIILFLLYKYYADADLEIDKKKTFRDWAYSILFIFGIIFSLVLFAWNKSINYNPLEKGRMENRFTSFFNFNKVHEYGTRESEKQAQFFAELSKYTYPSPHGQYEPIHSGISSFIDPVVKNDLSAPFGLIYQFGTNWWFIPIVVLIFTWVTLFYFVLRMSVTPTVNTNNQMFFTKFGIIRIYCICIIVSSGFWLLASYYSIVPFTGRLIYGLGQDSIAEVFETIYLFSFMGLISKTND